MKSQLDFISIEEVEGVMEYLKIAIDKEDRWYTIKGLDDMRRVHIALCEWLKEQEDDKRIPAAPLPSPCA